MPCEFGTLILVDSVLHARIAALDCHFALGHCSRRQIASGTDFGNQLYQVEEET